MTYRYDQQNGAEGALFMLAAANSGADLIGSFGSTYNAIGTSAEMMLIHSAWLAAARYLKRGIQVDELRLGVESLRRTGPGGSIWLECGAFSGNGLLSAAGGAGALWASAAPAVSSSSAGTRRHRDS